MKHILELLKKFQNLTPPHEHIKKALIEAIAETLAATIEKKDIVVRGNILAVHTSPHLKNAITLQKKLILERLKEKTNTKKMYDIR